MIYAFFYSFLYPIFPQNFVNLLYFFYSSAFSSSGINSLFTNSIILIRLKRDVYLVTGIHIFLGIQKYLRSSEAKRSPSFRTGLVMGRARGDRNERAVSVSGMVDRLLAVVTRDRTRARTRVQPIIEPQV